MASMETLTRPQAKELKVLLEFVRLFCRAKHADASGAPIDLPAELASSFSMPVSLCPECAALVEHAIQKRRKCPLDPKPSCKHCKIHCYSKEYRARIREIMGYSGKRMILRGRLDYLWHYFF